MGQRSKKGTDDFWFDDIEEELEEQEKAEESEKSQRPEKKAVDFEEKEELPEETEGSFRWAGEKEPGEHFDDWEDEEEDFEEEDQLPANPKVMIGVFAGLVVLAALICALLWMFTHKDRGEPVAESTQELQQEDGTAADPSEDTALPEGEAENPPAEGGSSQESAAPDETTPGVGDNTGAEAGNTAAGENESTGGSTGDSAGQKEENAGDTQNGENAAGQQKEPVSGTAEMEFSEVSETVTAKDVTNLRSAPSTQDEGNVSGQIKNGETLLRTGVNETTGWSRLEYNGQTVYAVTQYLTTDLTYKTPVVQGDPNRVSTQDGRVILFTDCNDNVTPKEYVNLRIEPSTSQGDATVSCQISNGTTVHRTGYSPDSGWSRVEYNGAVLYVVTSMVYTVETQENASE